MCPFERKEQPATMHNVNKLRHTEREHNFQHYNLFSSSIIRPLLFLLFHVATIHNFNVHGAKLLKRNM
jgi:hypothetical protein